MNAPTTIAKPSLTVGYVMHEVAKAYGLDIWAMKSPRRASAVALPRMVAMWMVARLLPAYSLPMIGREFGNRDHTTVMHAIKRIEELADRDPTFFDTLMLLKAHLLAETDPTPPNMADIDRNARRLHRALTDLVELVHVIDHETIARLVARISKGERKR